MKIIHRFIVRNDSEADRAADIFSWGIPIPKAVVFDPARLALRDSSLRRLPLQADALALWADGSLKWALLTSPRFRIRSEHRRRLSLSIESPAKTTVRVALHASEQGLTLATDCLRFTLPPNGPLVPLFEIKTKTQWRALAADFDLAMTVERNGRCAEYLASRRDRAVTVEMAGPLRAMVAVRGIHAAEDGDVFGPYILRFDVVAGHRQVRLTHSVVFDCDPENDFVRASEARFRALAGDNVQIGFGGDAGHEIRMPRRMADWCPDFRHVELRQDSVSHWRARRRVEPDRSAVFCEEGLRSDGWMEISGDNGRVATAVREFWQNHPKALSADAAGGDARVQLYPATAEKLNLRRYSGLVYLHTYEAPCAWKKETMPFDLKFGARGIRKTHDLALFFNEANPSAAALHYNRPLTVALTPKAMARTGALTPAASALDRRWLARIHRYLDFLGEAMLRDGGNGYIDYFDLPMGFNTRTGRWHHDFGGLGYINDEAMPCLGLWQAFFLTGRRDAFDLARAMTRHNSDIDSYYTGPWAGCGSRHNITHWGDMDKEQRISQPPGKRFLYYLTGDRSALDLVNVSLDMWDRILAGSRHLNMTAQVPALTATLMLADEAGLRRTGTWLHAIADALAASVNEHGQLNAALEANASEQSARAVSPFIPVSVTMFSAFGGVQSFAELAERLDHQPLRDALTRFARFLMLPYERRCALDPPQSNCSIKSDSLNVFRMLDLFGYAYATTRDKAFARHVRKHTRAVRVDIARLPQSRYGVPNKTSRPYPRCASWPDVSHEQTKAARKYYPLFHPNETAQLFEIAIYLHKAQGLMSLLT